MSPSNGWAGMDSVGSPNSALKKGFAYRHPIQPQPKQAAQPIQHIRYVLNGRSVSPHFCTAAHLPDNHKWSSQYHRKVQGIQHHSRSRQFYSFFSFHCSYLFILTQFLFTVSHSYVTKVSARILIPFPGGWAEYGLAFRTELLRRNHHSSWFIWLDVLSWVFSEALRSDGRIPVSFLTLHFIDWWELGWCELNWRRMIKEWLKWAGMSW